MAISPNPWIFSRRYDVASFVAPSIVALLLAAVLQRFSPTTTAQETLFWLLVVVAIDVSHVYATIYRTYLDPVARSTHGKRLVLLPLLVFAVGFALAFAGGPHFWRVAAYVAVFHFIKQHIGIVALYQRREHQLPRWPARLGVWLVTLAPIVHWHVYLRERFSWFHAGDFVDFFAPQMATAAWSFAGLWFVAYSGWRVRVATRMAINPLVDVQLFVVAGTWIGGIVYFAQDTAFTVTNVLPHGIAYIALVWRTGAKERLVRSDSTNDSQHMRPSALVATFLGSLLVLALVEEYLWDFLVSAEHPLLFGRSLASEYQDQALRALIVSLLFLPQGTHYLLDRWIWRPGPSNPNLARQLAGNPVEVCSSYRP